MTIGHWYPTRTTCKPPGPRAQAWYSTNSQCRKRAAGLRANSNSNTLVADELKARVAKELEYEQARRAGFAAAVFAAPAYGGTMDDYIHEGGFVSAPGDRIQTLAPRCICCL